MIECGVRMGIVKLQASSNLIVRLGKSPFLYFEQQLGHVGTKSSTEAIRLGNSLRTAKGKRKVGYKQMALRAGSWYARTREPIGYPTIFP